MNGIVTVFMVMGAWSLLGVSSAMAEDVELQLGDAAGINKLAVKDSLGVAQFSVDSDGAMTASGKVKAPNVGVIYTRWGRTVCPAGNTLVYDGYAAGAA